MAGEQKESQESVRRSERTVQAEEWSPVQRDAGRAELVCAQAADLGQGRGAGGAGVGR